jgi:hypothetical protein
MLKKDTNIYDVHTLYKMYVYHSNNEDIIIIGNIISLENNIFHINRKELHYGLQYQGL